MIDRHHAVYTQTNNVVGNLNLLYAIAEIDPSIHLVKLGTMGEYGTPNIDIEEGSSRSPTGSHRRAALPEAARFLLPPLQGARQRQHHVCLPHLGPALDRPEPGHRLRPGDRRDGAAPRARHPLRLRRCVRTVLNRFCVQAVVGHPSPSTARGPDPGMLDIRDTLACVELAITNPAEEGEYRVFNQFTESFSVASWPRWSPPHSRPGHRRQHRRQPRVEKEEHYYRPRTPSCSTSAWCPTCSAVRPSRRSSPSPTATVTGSTRPPSRRPYSGARRRARWPPPAWLPNPADRRTCAAIAVHVASGLRPANSRPADDPLPIAAPSAAAVASHLNAVLKRRRSRSRAIGHWSPSPSSVPCCSFCSSGGSPTSRRPRGRSTSRSTGPSVRRPRSSRSSPMSREQPSTRCWRHVGTRPAELQSQMDQLADASARTADQAMPDAPAPSPDVVRGLRPSSTSAPRRWPRFATRSTACSRWRRCRSPVLRHHVGRGPRPR